MAASGGRHFEINVKTENYQTQFISQKHVYTYTTLFITCMYKSFYGVILWILYWGSAELSTPTMSIPTMSTPKMSIPEMSTVPKCLLPKCLLHQNVYFYFNQW